MKPFIISEGGVEREPKKGDTVLCPGSILHHGPGGDERVVFFGLFEHVETTNADEDDEDEDG